MEEAVESVLVEYRDEKEPAVYASSGTLFSGRHVLVTANVFMTAIKRSGLDSAIEKVEHGVLHPNPFPEDVYLNVVSNNHHPRTAKISGYFVCGNVKSSARKVFRDWEIDSPVGKDSQKNFLGLFFALELIDDGLGNARTTFDEALRMLFDHTRNAPLELGQEICTSSSPFGNRNFLNSHSRGIVSNVLGEDYCFILSDCPTVPGSEGAPFFVLAGKRKTFVGIILASLSWWKGEWIGLTLGIDILSILRQLLNIPIASENIRPEPSQCRINQELIAVVTKSLVQIVCGSSWGTGIVFNKEKGIIVTNSHVVDYHHPVTVHWKGMKFKTKILFKTRDSGTYDLAVLKCSPENIGDLGLENVIFSPEPPETGETVYSGGFPLFSVDVKAGPTLTKGHVSQVHVSMLKTTCCVHPGASGGAVLRPNGKIIAVTVCNARLEDNGVVYPRVNMAIPLRAVHSVIDEYVMNEDRGILRNLHTTDKIACRPWQQLEGKL